MKSYLIEVPKKTGVSFEVLDYNRPYFHNPIHYHSTIELTLIINGEGTRFVGDNIAYFSEGDLVLLGANLPHQWRNDIQTSTPKRINHSKAIVIHFQENCFGNDFFLKPESYKIYTLLQNAKRGLKINGNTKLKVMAYMREIQKKQGFQRILSLLHILDIISNSQEIEPLASETYKIANKDSDIKKLDEVYKYVLENLTIKIPLSEIASKFHMSRTGFCRYFKSHTQKTFSRFVLESRISVACKLLHENKLNISQIAYDCGFNNVSFFIKEFKSVKGVTPLKYRKQFQQNYTISHLKLL